MVLRVRQASWMKDDHGIWIEHGKPAITPQEVRDQQDMITQAKALYQQIKTKGTDLSVGPCLGTIGDYAIDIAHNPRIAVDNDPANQCAAYRNGTVNHFIELDVDGNIIRIV